MADNNWEQEDRRSEQPYDRDHDRDQEMREYDAGRRSASPRGGDRSPRRDRSMSPARAPRGPREDRGGDSEGARNSGSNLFVTGIATRLTEPELIAIFNKYGTVAKCQIMLDPHTKESRGFGFVCMSSPEEADECRDKLTGEEHFGRTLSVEKARRSRPRTPTPGKYFGPPKREDFRAGPPRRRYDDREFFDRRPRYDDRHYDRRDRYDDRPRYDDRYDGRYERRDRYDDRRGGDRGAERGAERGGDRYDDRRGYERAPPGPPAGGRDYYDRDGRDSGRDMYDAAPRR
ncbi:hypothetical protein YB2330_005566 [Saitoella coloradoensis]